MSHFTQNLLPQIILSFVICKKKVIPNDSILEIWIQHQSFSLIREYDIFYDGSMRPGTWPSTWSQWLTSTFSLPKISFCCSSGSGTYIQMDRYVTCLCSSSLSVFCLILYTGLFSFRLLSPFYTCKLANISD